MNKKAKKPKFQYPFTDKEHEESCKFLTARLMNTVSDKGSKVELTETIYTGGYRKIELKETLYIKKKDLNNFGEALYLRPYDQVRMKKLLDFVVSAPLRENFGFLITTDNQTIYFAGDMFYESGIDVSNLEVDIALLPVGTFYTFGPQEAFDFAKKFKNIGKVTPMHYEKNPETREEFIKLAVAQGFNTDSYIL